MVYECDIHSSEKILACDNGRRSYDVPFSKVDNYHFICRKSSEHLAYRLYIIALEEQLAKCSPGVTTPPKVTDCGFDASASNLLCSDGTSDTTIPLIETDKYICLSSTDYTLIKNYRDDLRKDISQCKPSS